MYKKLIGSSSLRKLCKLINNSTKLLEIELNSFHTKIQSFDFTDFNTAYRFYEKEGVTSLFPVEVKDALNKINLILSSSSSGSGFYLAQKIFGVEISGSDLSNYDKDTKKITDAFEDYGIATEKLYDHIHGKFIPDNLRVYYNFHSIISSQKSFTSLDDIQSRLLRILGSNKAKTTLEGWGDGFVRVEEKELALVCYEMVDEEKANFFKYSTKLNDCGKKYFYKNCSKSVEHFLAFLHTRSFDDEISIEAVRRYRNDSKIKIELEKIVNSTDCNITRHLDLLIEFKQYEKAFEIAARKHSSKALNYAGKYNNATDAAITLLKENWSVDAISSVLDRVTDYAPILALLESRDWPPDLAKVYKASGDYKSAAEQWLRIHNGKEAAFLYKEIGCFDKVFEIYEEFELFSEAIELSVEIKNYALAAQLCVKCKKFNEAAEYFLMIGMNQDAVHALMSAAEYQKAADLLLEDDDIKQAAFILSKGGKHKKAAKLYCELKQFHEAAVEYSLAGMNIEAADNFMLAGVPIKAAEYYAKSGNRTTAAAICLDVKEVEVAAQYYVEAKHYDKAASVWLDNGETDKAIMVYVNAGEINTAAKMCFDFNRWNQAAELYVKCREAISAITCYLEAGKHKEAFNLLMEIEDVEQALDIVPFLENKDLLLENILKFPTEMLLRKAAEKGYTGLVAAYLLEAIEPTTLLAFKSFEQFYQALTQELSVDTKHTATCFIYSQLAKDIPTQLAILNHEITSIIEQEDSKRTLSVLQLNGYRMQLVGDITNYFELQTTILNKSLSNKNPEEYDPEVLKYFMVNCLINEDTHSFIQAQAIVNKLFPSIASFSEKVGQVFTIIESLHGDWNVIVSSFKFGAFGNRKCQGIHCASTDIVSSGEEGGNEFSPEQLAYHVCLQKKKEFETQIELFKQCLNNVITLSNTSTHDIVEPELISEFIHLYNDFAFYFSRLLSQQEQVFILATVCDIIKYKDTALHLQLIDILETEYNLDLAQ